MQACVQETITSIDAKILTLQTLRAQLISYFDEPVIPLTPGFSQVKTAAKKSPTVSTVSTSRRGDADRIISVAANLTEPLKITAFAEAAKIPKSSAKSSFNRWLLRGWLAKIGYGQYKRTKLFGKAVANTTEPATPAKPRGQLAQHILTEANRADLEKRLEDACSQRDIARANNRDTMVDMFQKEINELEAKLGS